MKSHLFAQEFLDKPAAAESFSLQNERLLKVKTFPLADPSGRCYPWPMV